MCFTPELATDIVETPIQNKGIQVALCRGFTVLQLTPDIYDNTGIPVGLLCHLIMLLILV